MLAKRIRRILWWGFLLGSVVGWLAVPAAQAQMQIIEMTYPDPDDVYWGLEVEAINDLNQITGDIRMRTGSSSSVLRAFLWDDGTLLNLGNGIDPNGVDHYSAGYALNNRGEVVGTAEDNMDLRRSFIWTGSVGMHDLNIPYDESEAHCINDAGFIGGYMIVNDGNGPEPRQVHGYIWHNGAVFDIPAEVSTGGGGTSAQIYDINNETQAVGSTQTANLTHLPIFVENSTIYRLNRLPGAGNWDHSFAVAINDDGVAVGTCYDPVTSDERAVLWTDKDAVPIDLGTLGGDEAEPFGINNRGQVVGMSPDVPGFFADDYPFIWQHGQMRNLNDLAPDGWEITWVQAINNAGWMVGQGKYGAQYKTILMKVDGFVRTSTGNADFTYNPTGFGDGGYTTAGLGADGVPLGCTVDVTNPEFGPGGYLTLEMDCPPDAVQELNIDEDTIGIYLFNGGVWGLAGRNTNTDQTSGEFVLGPPTGVKGDWGVDPACHFAWANVDHASTYTLSGTPEPATLALVALGAAAIVRRRRRTR